eukprot:2236929-Prymnesium_polylepis.1
MRKTTACMRDAAHAVCAHARRRVSCRLQRGCCGASGRGVQPVFTCRHGEGIRGRVRPRRIDRTDTRRRRVTSTVGAKFAPRTIATCNAADASRLE